MKRWRQIEYRINCYLLRLKGKMFRWTPSIMDFGGKLRHPKLVIANGLGVFWTLFRTIPTRSLGVFRGLGKRIVGRLREAYAQAPSGLSKSKKVKAIVFLVLRDLVKPKTIGFVFLFAGLNFLAGLVIYKNSGKIKREMASVPANEIGDRIIRPEYFRKTDKQFWINNIVFQASENKNGIKKLMIDFTFEASNKYIKVYFWNHPYLIQDVVNSTIEPFSLDFPLSEAGKTIIKEKVVKEVNLLLKRLHIKGEITRAYVDRIIGN